jgi:hypothetical protein
VAVLEAVVGTLLAMAGDQELQDKETLEVQVVSKAAAVAEVLEAAVLVEVGEMVERVLKIF